MIEVKSQHIFYMKALKQPKYINNILCCEFLGLGFCQKNWEKNWVFFPFVACAIGLIVKWLVN
jgi:hypothetical protein